MVIQQTRSATLCLLCWVIAILLLAPFQARAQDRDIPDFPSAQELFRSEPFSGDALLDEEEPGPEDLDAELIDVSVTPEGIVTMHIQDGELYAVLRELLFLTNRNIVFGKDVAGEVTVSLYNVTLQQALDSILKQNGYGYLEEGNFIYIYTEEELAEILAGERLYVIELFLLDNITPADADVLLRPFLVGDQAEIIMGPQAATGVGGGSGGQGFAIENMILVKDYEDNMDTIREKLALIDRRPKQVMVEATILRASLSETNQLGIDFNLLGGVDFELLQSDTLRLTHGPNQPAGVVGGQAQGGAGGQGAGAVGQGGGTGGLGAPGGLGGTGAAGGETIGSLVNTVPLSKLDDLTFGAATQFASAVPAGGLSIGIVTDQVSVFIRAMEAVTDVSVLANSKIPVVNKQQGKILVGSRDGYVGKVVATTTSEVSEVQFLETGTQLTFRPFIGNDGYIRMEITPRDSTGSVVEGLPSEKTTELTTNILVKDGHTILLGGLFREFTSTGRSQVPFLGNLPVLGEAFRSSEDITLREEVIILLTVHILDDDEDFAQQSAELLQDFERIRVGLREHVGRHGRERLAQVNYQKAVEYNNQGDYEKALWYVRMAIHNRPTFINALKLKEKLLQKRAWDDEGSLIRHFLRNLLMEKYGLPEQPFERPPLLGPSEYEWPTEPEERYEESQGTAEEIDDIEVFPPVGQQIPSAGASALEVFEDQSK